MPNILDAVLKELPEGVIESANFEGANIVVYTKDKDFFLKGEPKIRGVVDKIKKRIELRVAESLLLNKDETEKFIKKTIPKEADIQGILFDEKRSIVVIEVKRPGIAIGRKGEILKSIKEKTFWVPEAVRSPAIKSKITDAIRHVLFVKGEYRKRFLNSLGKKIYKEWSPEKREEWIRIGFLGGARQVGRSCFLLQTPESKILLDCGINIASETEKFPYLNVPEFDLKAIDAVIITHAHLDHSGLLPYLYRLGYRGPCYMSVDYAEPVLIKENGRIKKIKIGEFIDRVINNSKNVEKLPQHYNYASADLSTNKEAIAFSGIDYKLRFRRIKKVIRHRICDGDNLYKIKTKTGRSISVTGAHSVFILKNGEIRKARVNQLKSGDYLVVPQKLPTTIIKEIDIREVLNDFKSDNYYIYVKQGHKIPTKLTLSPELMRILGYFTAEGNFDKRSLQFSFGLKDVNYVKELVEDVENVFGIKPRVNISKGNVLRVSINSKVLRELFFRFFFKSHTLALTKRVPEIVLNTSDEFKMHFLRAYFNGDGTINYHNWTAVAMTVSKELLSDLTYICSQIGINYYTCEGYLAKSAKTKNKVYQLAINLRDFFESQKICRSSSNLIPLKETRFNDEWYYHRLKTKLHVTKERLISLLNSNLIKCGNSMQIKTVLSNLANSDLAFLPIISIEKVEPTNGYVYDISVEGDQNFVAGETPICLHNTAPTRDITALLALDYIGVAYKKALKPLYRIADIQTMVKHSIALNYNEVTDITPDVRLTLYNAGHTLGSAMTHLNIGNGLHNLLYTSDFKFAKTNVLESAISKFPRLETVIIESTYGGKQNVLPSRKECENILIEAVNKSIARKGKVLIPVLGVGRAQEVMMIVDKAAREKKLPDVPIYVDGMVWDVTAIHTAYPEFMAGSLRNAIFQDKNPFASELFKRVGSPTERKEILEGGPCIILATSGMLVGGASVEYFRNLADNKRNALIFVCYQGPGSLGRQVQEGAKEVRVEGPEKEETVAVNFEITSIDGLTGHAGRNELLSFVNSLSPMPRRIIVQHGEVSRSLDLASTLYKLHRIETNVPRNLDVMRLH